MWSALCSKSNNDFLVHVISCWFSSLSASLDCIMFRVSSTGILVYKFFFMSNDANLVSLVILNSFILLASSYEFLIVYLFSNLIFSFSRLAICLDILSQIFWFLLFCWLVHMNFLLFICFLVWFSLLDGVLYI